MIPDEATLANFLSDIDKLSNKYKIDYEEFMIWQAYGMERDSKKQTDDRIKSCLDGAADLLRHASMNYYCSFK